MFTLMTAALAAAASPAPNAPVDQHSNSQQHGQMAMGSCCCCKDKGKAASGSDCCDKHDAQSGENAGHAAH